MGRPPTPGTAGKAQFRDLIAESPALQAHRHWMFARCETELAALLAEQSGSRPDSVEPFVAAVALVGVLRAAFEAGASHGRARNGDADRCVDLLAHGLGDYPPARVG